MLSVSELHYRHGGAAPLLEGVTFAVADGECVALLGRSGSGKSTLLQLVAGLVRAQSGRIAVQGTAVEQLQEPALTALRRETVGFVYQHFCLLPTLTLLENVAMPLELMGKSPDVAATHAAQRLAQLDIGHLAERFPDQVSGGEQQRAGIARAMVAEPPLVLADEPTGSLDADNGERVFDALLEITRRERRSVLIATHSAALAARADRILTLRSGQIVEGAGDDAW